MCHDTWYFKATGNVTCWKITGFVVGHAALATIKVESMFPFPFACGMWSILYDMMHNRKPTDMAMWECKCSHRPGFAGVRVLYSTHTCFSWHPVQTLTSSVKHAQNPLAGQEGAKEKESNTKHKKQMPCGFFPYCCAHSAKRRRPSETAHTSQWDRKRNGILKFVKSVTRLSCTGLDRHVVGKAQCIAIICHVSLEA